MNVLGTSMWDQTIVTMEGQFGKTSQKRKDLFEVWTGIESFWRALSVKYREEIFGGKKGEMWMGGRKNELEIVEVGGNEKHIVFIMCLFVLSNE